MPPGIAAMILAQIDAALDEGDVPRALALERMLPPTLGAEPAVVDRLVTLRLLEGDATTAAAGLGACPEADSPRLQLLALVVSTHVGDRERLRAHLAADRDAGLMRRILSVLLLAGSAVEGGSADQGRRADPAPALCAVAAEYPRPVASLTAALAHLDQLLSVAAQAAGPVAADALRALRGVARDLDIGIATSDRCDELAVTPTDRMRLRLRAA